MTEEEKQGLKAKVEALQTLLDALAERLLTLEKRVESIEEEL